jgi:hypothetical protein
MKMSCRAQSLELKLKEECGIETSIYSRIFYPMQAQVKNFEV